MNKKCICEDGKVDPKCPACNKGEINLDSHFKLNPEAKPPMKTAAQFKIAAPGFMNSITPEMKARLMGAGKTALTTAAIPAAGAALTAGLTADPGQGFGDAAKAGLTAGVLGGAAGAGHHMAITGSNGLSRGYQKGVGQIQSAANDFRSKVLPPPQGVDPSMLNMKQSQFYEYGRTAALATYSI